MHQARAGYADQFPQGIWQSGRSRDCTPVALLPQASKLDLIPKVIRGTSGRGEESLTKPYRTRRKNRPRPASHLIMPRQQASDVQAHVDYQEINKRRLTAMARKLTSVTNGNPSQISRDIWKKPERLLEQPTILTNEERHPYVKKGQGQHRFKRLRVKQGGALRECCQLLHKEEHRCLERPISQNISSQKITVYSPILFRPEILIKENKFMRYVYGRVVQHISSHNQLLECLFILRDRINLLTSSCAQEIAKKQPIVLHQYSTRQLALKYFQQTKEHYKRIIGAHEVKNNDTLDNKAIGTNVDKIDLSSLTKQTGSEPHTPTNSQKKFTVVKRNRFSQISRGDSLRFCITQPIVNLSASNSLGNSQASSSYSTANSSLVFNGPSKKQKQTETDQRRITEELSQSNSETIENSSQRSDSASDAVRQGVNQLQEMSFGGGVQLQRLNSQQGQEVPPLTDSISGGPQRGKEQVIRPNCPISAETKKPLLLEVLKDRQQSKDQKVQQSPSKTSQPLFLLEDNRIVSSPIQLSGKPTGRAQPRNSKTQNDLKLHARRKGRAKHHFEMNMSVHSEDSILSFETIEDCLTESKEISQVQISSFEKIDFSRLLATLKMRRKFVGMRKKQSDKNGQEELAEKGDSSSEPRLRYLHINPHNSFVENKAAIIAQCKRLQPLLNEFSEDIFKLDEQLPLQKPKGAPKPSASQQKKQSIFRSLEKMIVMVRQGVASVPTKRKLLEFMQHFIRVKLPRRKDEEEEDRARLVVDIQQTEPAATKDNKKHTQIESKILELLRWFPRQVESETLNQQQMDTRARLITCKSIRGAHLRA